MCLGDGSHLGMPVSPFASLLWWELGVIEKATCASGTGPVWVCQSGPSLCFCGIWGSLRGQHVPREQEPSGCARWPFALSAYVGSGGIFASERAACALGTGAIWVCQSTPSPLCLHGNWGDIIHTRSFLLTTSY